MDTKGFARKAVSPALEELNGRVTEKAETFVPRAFDGIFSSLDLGFRVSGLGFEELARNMGWPLKG